MPLGALQLLWRLEDRGLTVQLRKQGRLFVGPRDALTDEDRTDITAHRDTLAQLVAYCEQDAEDPT